jgi:GNAT superfamily N-acetyltransferase
MPSIYLEDIFVRATFRRNGIGRALLRHMAALAAENSRTRFVWQVLDWNTPAVDFYEAQGARLMKSWVRAELKAMQSAGLLEWRSKATQNQTAPGR